MATSWSLRVPVAVAALALVADIVPAQCVTPEEVWFQASDIGAGNLFGYSSDMERELAVVGSPRNDFVGANSGAVYVMRRTAQGMNEVQKLIAASSIAHDRFGYSLDLSGELLIVGARRAREQGRESGAAYVFRHDGTRFVEEARLLASDGAEDDEFGFSVSIHGDAAVVGAPFKDGSRNKEGAAYVFRRGGDGRWREEQKLLSPDADPGPDQFGRDVAIEGAGLLVGADLDNDPGFDSGSVFCFEFDGLAWSATQKIAPADGATGDRFGTSLALDGTTLVVGAPGVDLDGEDAGALYLYHHDGQSWLRSDRRGGGSAARELGRSIALAGGTVVAGAPGGDRAGASTGAAHVFRIVDGALNADRVLVSRVGASGDELGFSVSTDGRSAFVGAVFSDQGPGPDAGLIAAYELPPLALGSNRFDPAAGEDLQFQGCNPDGPGPALLIAVNIDGVAVDQRVHLGRFDGLGGYQAGGLVPPGLAGMEIEFLLAGLDRTGRVVPSNLLRLTFR